MSATTSMGETSLSPCRLLADPSVPLARRDSVDSEQSTIKAISRGSTAHGASGAHEESSVSRPIGVNVANAAMDALVALGQNTHQALSAYWRASSLPQTLAPKAALPHPRALQKDYFAQARPLCEAIAYRGSAMQIDRAHWVVLQSSWRWENAALTQMLDTLYLFRIESCRSRFGLMNFFLLPCFFATDNERPYWAFEAEHQLHVPSYLVLRDALPRMSSARGQNELLYCLFDDLQGVLQRSSDRLMDAESPEPEQVCGRSENLFALAQAYRKWAIELLVANGRAESTMAQTSQKSFAR